MVTITQHPQGRNRDTSVEQAPPAPTGRSTLREIRLPTIQEPKWCVAFSSIDATEKPFFPDVKAHTSSGQELRSLAQTQIHFASKEYRLRSDHLAQTLRLFGHTVSRHLPDGFCVQVDLSPNEGTSAFDTVSLIHYSPKDGAQAILEQRYAPFNGGGIGWMVPTDEAKNIVLKLEERLFYYKTLLAIKTAIDNRLSLLSAPT